MRRSPAERAHRDSIRQLWTLTRHLPAGQLLPDPVTGQLLGTDRHLGLLWLVVTAVNRG